MANRKEVYWLVRYLHPERWGKGSTRDWDLPRGGQLGNGVKLAELRR